jgi:hypothetical protein
MSKSETPLFFRALAVYRAGLTGKIPLQSPMVAVPIVKNGGNFATPIDRSTFDKKAL